MENLCRQRARTGYLPFACLWIKIDRPLDNSPLIQSRQFGNDRQMIGADGVGCRAGFQNREMSAVENVINAQQRRK
jgi:hypothetical protein